MAKRLYFANAASSFTPTSPQGTWHTTTSNVAKELADAASGAAATRGQAKGVSTNPGNVLWGRWISKPAAKTGTLTGIVQLVAGVVESASNANAFFQVHIYVTQGDTNAVRGTALSNFTGASEFTTTSTGSAIGYQTLTDVAVTAGDRIVVEIGYQGQSNSSSSSATMDYGNTGTIDLRIASTAVTTRPGWIQFSDPNNVIDGDPGSGRHNFCSNPAVGTNIDGWNTGTNTTLSRLTGQSGFSRSTVYRATINTVGNPSVNSPRTSVCEGEVWSAYVEIRGSAARSVDVWFNYTDAGGNFLSPNPNVSLTLTPNAVHVITIDNQTAPANVVDLGISYECGVGIQVGDTFDCSCVVVDQTTTTIPDYKDGSFASWVWNGTSENSSSKEVFSSVATAAQLSGFMPFFM